MWVDGFIDLRCDNKAKVSIGFSTQCSCDGGSIFFEEGLKFSKMLEGWRTFDLRQQVGGEAFEEVFDGEGGCHSFESFQG